MGADATTPSFVKMKTGIYLGNGLDDRAIDIGVNLFNKAYCYVMVWANGATRPVFYCTPAAGDQSFFFDETVELADNIQALTDTGFEVGQGANVNTNAVNYMYLAVWQSQHL